MHAIIAGKNHTAPMRIRMVQSTFKPSNNVNEVLKRCFDIVFSLLFIISLSPVLLLISLIIKFNSKGPVLYKQTRVMKNSQHFQILKFRSLPPLIEDSTGPIPGAGGDDDRADRLGRVLRTTRIDELPQLFNILRGDMSFIGPRPERPYFVEKFKKQVNGYEHRHNVKPGLAGYAQVVDPFITYDHIAEKTAMDIYYIENWSLRLEAWIILKAFTYVLPYGFSALKLLLEPSLSNKLN